MLSLACSHFFSGNGEEEWPEKVFMYNLLTLSLRFLTRKAVIKAQKPVFKENITSSLPTKRNSVT